MLPKATFLIMDYYKEYVVKAYMTSPTLMVEDGAVRSTADTQTLVLSCDIARMRALFSSCNFRLSSSNSSHSCNAKDRNYMGHHSLCELQTTTYTGQQLTLRNTDMQKCR